MDGAYQCQCVKVLGMALVFEHAPKLVNLCILLGRRVAGVAALRGRGRCGEVEGVVFGIELELRGGGGRHAVRICVCICVFICVDVGERGG